MAIGWAAVLQAVPWSQVIENAPKVAEGAMKLWNAVARKPGPAALAADEPGRGRSPEAPALASFEQRVAAIEASATELHSQMLASSELIKSLAEQNAQLVRRIEANRVRVRWLSAVAGVALLLAMGALYVALTGDVA